jgi:uncharacterized protein
MNIEQYFKDSKVFIWNEVYAIVKAHKIDPEAFANIVDKDEVSIIIAEKCLKDENVIEVEKGWRIFTLDVVFPMSVCGITAKIATALAVKNISIMPIAAFSRDHFLIKEENLTVAKQVFQELGSSVQNYKE